MTAEDNYDVYTARNDQNCATIVEDDDDVSVTVGDIQYFAVTIGDNDNAYIAPENDQIFLELWMTMMTYL